MASLVKVKTIGIGSLPHHCVNDAVNYSLKHDIPFLPQMTSLGEQMISQVTSKDDLEKKYQALSRFIEKLIANNKTEFKIQIAGPSTCNSSEKIILLEINNFLKFFDKFNLQPIIFIDEPVFKNNLNNLVSIFNELTKLNIVSGLHSCARFDWEQVSGLNTKYISYDANIMPLLKENNHCLITGIPPFKKGPFNIAGGIISSSCGLASYTENECELILENLNSYK